MFTPLAMGNKVTPTKHRLRVNTPLWSTHHLLHDCGALIPGFQPVRHVCSLGRLGNNGTPEDELLCLVPGFPAHFAGGRYRCQTT
jgi:hypothetical protein